MGGGERGREKRVFKYNRREFVVVVAVVVVVVVALEEGWAGALSTIPPTPLSVPFFSTHLTHSCSGTGGSH